MKTMKTILPLIFFALISLNLLGQTLVSAEIEPRNVILEEFTGINCINCPRAHEEAAAIKKQYPEDFFIINHHTGYFATPSEDWQPDFVTKYGASLDARSGLTGYPAGTVNRHRFSDFLMNEDKLSSTAQYRFMWGETTEIVLGENSFVNMGVEANWDYLTNEITVHVEAYFTSDSPLPENLINVALLQDSTFAYQIGRGDEYIHNNRLVDFISPYDGALIDNTTKGSFYDQTFTYLVPDNYSEVPVDISNLKIVAFLAGYPYEIETGTACNITYSNIPGNDVSVFEIEEIFPKCDGLLTPIITIRNNAGQELTSLDIAYNVEGQSTHYYTWTGSLSSYKKTKIILPEISFDLDNINEFEVLIVNNDDDTSNNESTITFMEDTPLNVETELLTIEVQSNYYGSLITWEVLNSSDEVIMEGGPYEDWDDQVHSASIVLDENSCYSLFFYYSEQNPNASLAGYYKILSDDEILYMDSDVYLSERVGIKTSEFFYSSNTDMSLKDVDVFPNPVSQQLNLRNCESMQLEMFDLLGNRVYQIDEIAEEDHFDISNLTNGIYLVEISNEYRMISEKIMIMK